MDDNFNDLIGETDADHWVKRWLELMEVNPDIAHDEGAMRAWFAGAIMAGYDDGQRVERMRDIGDRLREVIFQAAGAATRPLLEDHPHYVFPSERVLEAVEEVCADFGIPPKERHSDASAG